MPIGLNHNRSDMKRVLTYFTICMLMSTGSFAQQLSLEEILSRHGKAMGFERLQKVNSMVLTGTLTQNDLMPVKITRLRPDKYLMEFDVADITAYQGFDGTTAWMTAPWTGNAGPQTMTEERTREMRVRADFEGVLYDWSRKGHQLELAGTDTLEAGVCYRVKVTRKDGVVEYHFIDQERFLDQKRLYYRKIRGNDTPMEMLYRDYRPVDGVLFPFTQETRIGGQPYNTLQLEQVLLNVSLDPAQFSMPGK